MQPRPQQAPSTHRPRRRGEQARARITEILHARLREQQSAPTLDELMESTGLKKTAIRYHVRVLQQAGIVRFASRREVCLIPDAHPEMSP